MNREIESMAMRPLAKDLTRSLEEVRNITRDQALRDLNNYTDRMKEALRQFDGLFAEFELRYLKICTAVLIFASTYYDIFMRMTRLHLCFWTVHKSLQGIFIGTNVIIHKQVSFANMSLQQPIKSIITKGESNVILSWICLFPVVATCQPWCL